MSPLALRRYRAERLLREEFERLRGSVIGSVRGRLRASGVSLDASDLEACYAQAWQGLYAAVLEGQQIANPSGWLTLVTFRRAIDEHRGRRRPADIDRPAAEERDFASQLDDLTRLRQLFEALRGRLSARELEAATLCYLQGLSRAEAASRMGVSETGMGKLMEGRGAGRPGVAGKVSALVETIRAGAWCEEQGSLMRGLAYGILDPQGERYRLAMSHSSECPACRAYVASLRGLAAVLPPVPALLRWALSTAVAAGKGAAAGAGAGGGGAAAAGAGGAGAAGGGAAGAGVAGAGAAGAGASGGWLLAGGSVGAKLAVGCLLALGVGAGCIALGEHPAHPRSRVRAGELAREREPNRGPADAGVENGWAVQGPLALADEERRADALAAPPTLASSPLSSAREAIREFGPERGLAGSVSASPDALTARTATAASVSDDGASAAVSRGPPSPAAPTPDARAARGAPSAAEREFSPG